MRRSALPLAIAACAVLTAVAVSITGRGAPDERGAALPRHANTGHGDPAQSGPGGGDADATAMVARPLADMAAPPEDARATRRTAAPEAGFPSTASSEMSVQVVDPSGDPVEGEKVQLSWGHAGKSVNRFFGVSRRRTNEAGWAEFTLDPKIRRREPDIVAVASLDNDMSWRLRDETSTLVTFAAPGRIVLPDPASLVPGSLRVVIRRSASIAPSEPLSVRLTAGGRAWSALHPIPNDVEWSTHEWTDLEPGGYALRITSSRLPPKTRVALLTGLEVPPGGACEDERLLSWDPLAEANVARLDVTLPGGARPDELVLSVRREGSTRLRTFRSIDRWPVQIVLPHDDDVELTLRSPGSGIVSVPGRAEPIAVALPAAVQRTVRWSRTPSAPAGWRSLRVRRIPGSDGPPGTGWEAKIRLDRHADEGEAQVSFPCPGRYRVQATRGAVEPNVLVVVAGSDGPLEVTLDGSGD
ncbi:MAG: hypothetical protein AAGB93_08085 [Planctomycetota bacterium]